MNVLANGCALVGLLGLGLVAGCGGGGDPCADLTTAVTQAAAAPGCSVPLADAKLKLGNPATCAITDDTDALVTEAQAECFAAVQQCDSEGRTIASLNQCLNRAAQMMAPM